MLKRNFSFVGETKATRSSRGGLKFVASTDAPARDGIMLKQDWDLRAFRSNPVFLWEHNSHPLLPGLPIGMVDRVAVKKNEEFGKHLRAEVIFVPEDVYPFARQVERFYLEGWLRSVSVGFNPTRIRLATLEELRANGMSENDFLLVGEEPELIELSAAVVPVDVNALKSRGYDLGNPEQLLEKILGGADKRGIVQFIDQKRSELRKRHEEARNDQTRRPTVAITAPVQATDQDLSFDRVFSLLQGISDRLEVMERAVLSPQRAVGSPEDDEEDEDILEEITEEDGDQDPECEDDDLIDDLEDEDADDDADDDDEEDSDDDGDPEASAEGSAEDDDDDDFPVEFPEDEQDSANVASEEDGPSAEDLDEFGDPVDQAEPNEEIPDEVEDSEIEDQLGAAIGAVDELLSST